MLSCMRLRLRLSVCDLQKLQEELEEQQLHVNSLQNMVVVVDESNTDSGENTIRCLLENDEVQPSQQSRTVSKVIL